MARLTIHITFHCTVISAFYCIIVIADQSLYFQRCLESPARLSHTYRREEELTLLTCCRLCSLDPDCMSVNYNELLSKCEFNNKSCYFNTYELETEDGWDVYSAIYIKGICFFNLVMKNLLPYNFFPFVNCILYAHIYGPSCCLTRA